MEFVFIAVIHLIVFSFLGWCLWSTRNPHALAKIRTQFNAKAPP